MNRHSEALTVRFYDQNAEDFVQATVGVNMEPLYGRFLSHIPSGGLILDAGCGSGRDSKAFLDKGYQVVSIDASRKMVEATSRLTGQKAHLMAFHEIELPQDFHGIWACASLLHVPLGDLEKILANLSAILQPSGVLYASFKLGQGERNQGGRHFTDLDEEGIAKLIDQVSDLELIETWLTDDQRPGRGDKWINALVRKRG